MPRRTLRAVNWLTPRSLGCVSMYSTSALNRNSSRESTVSVLMKKRLAQLTTRPGTSFSQYANAPAAASSAACRAGWESRPVPFMNAFF
ncbi:hypothetical protein [Ottowia beijingensis]|uniref:hypothetical protein n=1 Tax=Ottowia beijingensis TaxID=1207057 RepID=UPI0028052B8C|nr:hypothetical protein [Ottowia beijingensis]